MSPPSSHGGRDAATAGAALVGVALAGHVAPSIAWFGQWLPFRALPGRACVWRGRVPGLVSLTFDDGPSPEWTPAVVRELERHGMRATFFCLGSEAVRYPAVVEDLAARGHQVELHGFAHEHHLLRSPRWVREDIAAAVAAMEALGIRPRWLRPPYGELSAGTVVAARRERLRLALWSVWGREWSDTTPGGAARRVTRALHDRAVVLLHDSEATSPPGTAQRAIEAVAAAAAEMRRRRLRAATLDEVMGWR